MPSIKDILLIDWYDNLSKVIRVTAFVYLMMDVIKGKCKWDQRLSNKRLNDANDLWIRYTQHSNYAKEIKQIESGIQVDKSSQLVRLCPFIDTYGILRVRGRIANANVPYDSRFPVIIPAHTQFARLMMLEAHKRTLHGNIQQLLCQSEILDHW